MVSYPLIWVVFCGSKESGSLGAAVYLRYGTPAPWDQGWEFQRDHRRLPEWRHGCGAGTEEEHCAQVNTEFFFPLLAKEPEEQSHCIRYVSAVVGHANCLYLRKTRLCVCRYEYLRREGNFERSSGLQMGVDNIEVRKKQKRFSIYRICESIAIIKRTVSVWIWFFKVIMVLLKNVIILPFTGKQLHYF